MSSNPTMYSLFADNGDVVYIEDEWNEGEKKDIIENHIEKPEN